MTLQEWDEPGLPDDMWIPGDDIYKLKENIKKVQDSPFTDRQKYLAQSAVEYESLYEFKKMIFRRHVKYSQSLGNKTWSSARLKAMDKALLTGTQHEYNDLVKLSRGKQKPRVTKSLRKKIQKLKRNHIKRKRRQQIRRMWRRL